MNSPGNGMRLADKPAMVEEAAHGIRRPGSTLVSHRSMGGMRATASGVVAWRRMYPAQDVSMSSGGANGQAGLGETVQVVACCEFHSIFPAERTTCVGANRCDSKYERRCNGNFSELVWHCVVPG